MLNLIYWIASSVEGIDESRVGIILLVDLEVQVVAKNVMEERDFISIH